MRKLLLKEGLSKWSETALIVNQLIYFASRIDPFANSDLGQAEPADKLDGLLAYADGITWNPGSGKGFYRWDATAAVWVYGAGSPGVTSFNARVGAVLPTLNDYTWAQINKATSSLADITSRNHALLGNLTADDHTQYGLKSFVIAMSIAL